MKAGASSWNRTLNPGDINAIVNTGVDWILDLLCLNQEAEFRRVVIL